LMGAEQEGLSAADLTRTPTTLCGLPSETVDIATPEPFKTVAVVAESAGDTYLIAVVQVGGSGDPEQQNEVDAVLSGIEVLPQEGAAS
jgi:hypothetical protein